MKRRAVFLTGSGRQGQGRRQMVAYARGMRDDGAKGPLKDRKRKKEIISNCLITRLEGQHQSGTSFRRSRGPCHTDVRFNREKRLSPPKMKIPVATVVRSLVKPRKGRKREQHKNARALHGISRKLIFRFPGWNTAVCNSSRSLLVVCVACACFGHPFFFFFRGTHWLSASCTKSL